MTVLKFALVTLSSTILVACGHYSEDLASMEAPALQDIAPAAGQISTLDFSDQLAQNYLKLAQQENSNFDYKSARYFTNKAKQAQSGQTPPPAQTREFSIPKAKLEKVALVRQHLSDSLETKMIPANYMALAQAQTQFDYWLEQLQEGHQETDIQNCFQDIEQALANLVSLQPQQTDFTIHFAEGAYTLNDQALTMLDDIVLTVQANSDYAVTIIGHTSDAESENLAIARASNIRTALLQAGLSPDTIQAYTGQTANDLDTVQIKLEPASSLSNI